MSAEDFTEEISEPCSEGAGVTIDDFVAYMPMHSYIFTPCREMWAAMSVNARIPPVPVLGKNGKPKRKDGKIVTVRVTRWLDQNRPVEQMTWCPGLPMLIRDRLVVDGGWIERPEVTCFNHYRPPRIVPGDATEAGPWLEHMRKIYPDDAAHIIAWLAHRVQRPGEKINHALVLGGAQGIGKDTLLEPIKHAVGPWNFKDVIPANLMGRFNSFTKAVILRVSEARDLGDAERVNRGLPRRARSLRLRSEGPAAKNAGLVRHRQRQCRARRRRIGGCDRYAQQPRRYNAQAAGRRGERSNRRLADGAQEPSRTAASARALRLHFSE